MWIAGCLALLVLLWLVLAKICDHHLAKIIKRLAAQAGLDPELFSGHSLRSGLATSASHGASERSIMDQTRHRSLQQVRNNAVLQNLN